LRCDFLAIVQRLRSICALIAKRFLCNIFAIAKRLRSHFLSDGVKMVQRVFPAITGRFQSNQKLKRSDLKAIPQRL
jgi:hypothetical protein